jgi:prophage antirepressor-like protein
MQLLNFPLESISKELPAVKLDNGDWIFSAKATCVFADLTTEKNAASWVRNNIPPKWYLEFKIPGHEGRPGLYLTKPGFYYAICQGRSESAMKFRDEVFEVILPKIDASGGYIMPNATSDQLEALTAEIEQLKEEKRIAISTANLYDAEYGNPERSRFYVRREGYIEQTCRQYIQDNHPSRYHSLVAQVDADIKRGRYGIFIPPSERKRF